MPPRIVPLILLFLVQHAAAAVSQRPAPLFPESPAPITPERSIGFMTNGRHRVAIASYRFKPKAGLTQWSMMEWCGVTITTGRAVSMPLLVIGTGQTGALTCLGLKDAGLMPSRRPEIRVGLIYRTASPNFPVTTPVLLSLDPVTGEWRVDHRHDDEFGRVQPAPTLVSMRQILTKSGN